MSAGTSGGGKPDVKPLPYSPPVGPQNPAPTNHGNCGTQRSGK